MKPPFAVLSGGAAAPASPPRSQLEIGSDYSRLERKGDLVSGNMLVKAIRRGSFAGVGELVAAIHNFLDATNQDPTV